MKLNAKKKRNMYKYAKSRVTKIKQYHMVKSLGNDAKITVWGFGFFF